MGSFLCGSFEGNKAALERRMDLARDPTFCGLLGGVQRSFLAVNLSAAAAAATTAAAPRLTWPVFFELFPRVGCGVFTGFTFVFCFCVFLSLSLSLVWLPSFLVFSGFCLLFSSLFGRWFSSNPDRSAVVSPEGNLRRGHEEQGSFPQLPYKGLGSCIHCWSFGGPCPSGGVMCILFSYPILASSVIEKTSHMPVAAPPGPPRCTPGVIR